MFKYLNDLSWEDIAQAIVGKSTTEKVSTGVTAAGVGLVGWGLVTGDHADVIEGAGVAGIGLGVRAVSLGYRVYKYLGGTPAPGDPVNQPKITQEQAENQLGLVDAAKTDDAQAEVLKKSAIELGLNEARWVQLVGKAKSGSINKPDAQLYNAVLKHAELACAS